MSAAELLNRLDRVRGTGENRWVAICPSHKDSHPSLSIRELPDGRVLIHDFAGCSAADILASVGLEYAALFPPCHFVHAPARPIKRPYNAEDVLACLANESTYVLIVANDMRKGIASNGERYARLTTATERILRAVEVSRG